MEPRLAVVIDHGQELVVLNDRPVGFVQDVALSVRVQDGVPVRTGHISLVVTDNASEQHRYQVETLQAIPWLRVSIVRLP